MLAFLTIIVATYTLVGFAEMAGAGKSALRGLAIGAALLTFGSCATAVLTTSDAPSSVRP